MTTKEDLLDEVLRNASYNVKLRTFLLDQTVDFRRESHHLMLLHLPFFLQFRTLNIYEYIMKERIEFRIYKWIEIPFVK